MPRPDCPRCGSALVVPALSGGPTERVLELRGGDGVPVGAPSDTFEDWLCRFCGHHWPHVHVAALVSSESPRAEDRAKAPADPAPPEPLLDPSDLQRPAQIPLTHLVMLPDVQGPSGSGEELALGHTGILRRAREARALTLSEAAKATGIWERYLQALESDAPPEDFLAPAYSRSFLREYAEFLGLDPAATVSGFDTRHPVLEEPPLEAIPDGRRRRRIVAAAMALASTITLVGLALLPLSSAPKAEPSASFSRSLGGILGHGHVARAPAPPAHPGVRAVLRVRQPCWVLATGDGRALAQATLPSGHSVVYRARHLLQLVLGNAGAVDLRVNGRSIATAGFGNVQRFEFRWRDGRLFENSA